MLQSVKMRDGARFVFLLMIASRVEWVKLLLNF